jgi:tetratricopeptide (TPR) repeat protein
VISSTTKSVAAALIAFAACGSGQEKKKEWKDQAEYQLVDGLNKEANPTTRLGSLDKWTKDYAATDFSDLRRKAYLITYQQLNRPKDAFTAAGEILQKDDPNDIAALSAIVGGIYQMNPPAAPEMDTAEKTSQYILGNLDTIYSPAKKPAGQTDEQWAQIKPQIRAFAQRTIGYIYFTRKDAPKAEVELTKALQLDPTQAVVSNWLASMLLAQQKDKPEKQQLALFQYARAASYDGPNSLPAANRQQILAFFQKAYATYHGSPEAADKVIAVAKTAALPPADFHIDSTADIGLAKIKAEEEAAKADPMRALWRTIKGELTDKGDAYFEASVKDAGLPGGANGVKTFKGKIISMTPANRPKEIVLAVEKADVADTTLKFEEALAGKMEPGEEIEFEGTAKAYTKEPFMLTFEVEPEKLVGWTGKNAAPVKKAVPKKKAN